MFGFSGMTIDITMEFQFNDQGAMDKIWSPSLPWNRYFTFRILEWSALENQASRSLLFGVK